MIRWDDAQYMCRKMCQDNTADGTTFQNMLMNVGYKNLLAMLGRQIIEQQATVTLTAGQRYYQVPPDCNMPKMLVIVDGQNRDEIGNEPSASKWEALRHNQQQGKPSSFFFRPRFGVGGGVIELNPIPSSAYSMELTYEATERDLSTSKYTTGTITLTNGSATVTGNGTVFTEDMVGRYLQPSGSGAQRLPYRIKSYVSPTSLTLENFYQGVTKSSLTFEIFEMFALPEDCQMLPIEYAAWMWWSTKGNPTRTGEHKKAFGDGLKQAKMTHAMTTRNPFVDTDDDMSGMDADYPSYFPAGVSS